MEAFSAHTGTIRINGARWRDLEPTLARIAKLLWRKAGSRLKTVNTLYHSRPRLHQDIRDMRDRAGLLYAASLQTSDVGKRLGRSNTIGGRTAVWPEGMQR